MTALDWFAIAAIAFGIWVVTGPKLKSERMADALPSPHITAETLEKLADTQALDTLHKYNCYETLSPKHQQKLFDHLRKAYRQELGVA